MMPAFSPALEPAITANAAPPAAAGEGSDSSPFAAVIQGLSPDATAPAATAASPTPTVAAAPGNVATLPATPVATDPLTSALSDVLQALGLSTAQVLPEATASATVTAGSDSAIATADASTPDTSATQPNMPVPLVPLLPAIVFTAPALTAATPVAGASASNPSASLDPALTSTIGSPVQHQARQWLATLAPAQSGSDNTNTTNALAVSQQPIANFPSITASPERGNAISDLAALTPDSLSLLTDAPKGLASGQLTGLPTAQSFAQTLGGAGSTAPTLATVLPNALQDPTWSDAFGQRVALLANQGTQTATLQLNPPELGPIQVRIALGEQGARVEFNTAQQTTSDLIETAMPRLAAAFEHQGLRLDDTRVNLISNRHDVFSAPSAFSASRQDTPQGDRGQPMPQHTSRPSSGPADGSPETATRSEPTRQPLNPGNTAIDYYA